MRYKRFIIENYKAIAKSLEIDLERDSLIPIIGINECGKTTILNSILAFDYFNDTYDSSIKQITDVGNLYDTRSSEAKITAVIEMSPDQFVSIVKEVRGKRARVDIPSGFKNEVTFSRVIDNKKKSRYELKDADFFGLKSKMEEVRFCEAIIQSLPFILYFDDFRDSFPDRIKIPKDQHLTGWSATIEELFKQTEEGLSIFMLKDMEDRRRKSVLSKVQKKLNLTLTREWANFKLDNRDSLEIAINFFVEDGTAEVIKVNPTTQARIKEKIATKEYFLSFEVVETDEDDDLHFFYVKDRSKGFYWFFNFVMKLEFNSKINGTDNNAIFLLDEPGSYLHPFAQQKLCKKLKDLSRHHKVLYCTHSHHLLDPEIIPINTIQVASKNAKGEVVLTPYHKLKKSGASIETAFQPIYDALELRPLPFEIKTKKILLVEGMYDFYAFNLFKGPRKINIMPCKGAESIVDFISLMIGFQIEYKAIWDNDPEGREKLTKAKKYFGGQEAEKSFLLLPQPNEKSVTITQSLFEGVDLKLFRESLGLENNCSYEKTIATVYFSNLRSELVANVSKTTREKFEAVFRLIGWS